MQGHLNRHPLANLSDASSTGSRLVQRKMSSFTKKSCCLSAWKKGATLRGATRDFGPNEKKSNLALVYAGKKM